MIWIHKDLEELDAMDRSKVGIEFFCRNMRELNGYTSEQMKELANYFSRECTKQRPSYNQTS